MNDLINGALEFLGALLLLNNCRLLLVHKRVLGVSVTPTVFFTFWGLWNLYFYPANGLWMSFLGGLCLAGSNLTWVALAIYFTGRRRPKAEEKRYIPCLIQVTH
jgi:hypothetical protein